MSGGYLNFKPSSLCSEIFGWDVECDYNLSSKELEKDREFVIKQNKLEDIEMSELVYDMLCLLYSYEWYKSGDIGKKQYEDDIKYFKEKWLLQSEDERLKRHIELGLKEFKEELYKAFLIERSSED